MTITLRPKTSPARPLLPRVAAGDPDAMAACMDRYGAWIRHQARTRVRDADRADDLVQEIFLELWRTADRYDPARGTEAAWISVVARRRLIDGMRRAGRGLEPEELSEVPVADPGLAGVEDRDEAALALEALDELRPAQRDLMRMWALEGRSHRQLAAETDLPLGTVKSHLRKGLAELRAALSAPALEAVSG